MSGNITTPALKCRKAISLLIASMIVLGGCVSSIEKTGRTEGCEAAELKLAYFAEKEIRARRFKDDLKHRIALAPVSFGLGFIANYFFQVVYVLPALAPGGFQLKGSEINAFGLNKALSYSRMTGSRLDKVDDGSIAKTSFQVAMCFYEEENWVQASAYLESVRGSKYELYVGEDNVAFYLGGCYYNLGMFDSAMEEYKTFLREASPYDWRRRQVNRGVRAIEAMSKKGLWGIGDDSQ